MEKERINKLIEGLQNLYDNNTLDSVDENTIQNTLIFLGSLIELKEDEVLNW